MPRLAAIAAGLALGLVLCACCMSGALAPPPPVDDDALREFAHTYAAQHQPELLGGVCSGSSSAGALAEAVAIAIVTRGHAGFDTAADVRLSPATCAVIVVVLVVVVGGVWTAVGARTEDPSGRVVARVGEDRFFAADSTGGSGDIFD